MLGREVRQRSQKRECKEGATILNREVEKASLERRHLSEDLRKWGSELWSILGKTVSSTAMKRHWRGNVGNTIGEHQEAWWPGGHVDRTGRRGAGKESGEGTRARSSEEGKNFDFWVRPVWNSSLQSFEQRNKCSCMFQQHHLTYWVE